jgi:hypothetical protein
MPTAIFTFLKSCAIDICATAANKSTNKIFFITGVLLNIKFIN